MSKLWVDKYAPKNLDEYISHKNKIIEIEKWINDYICNKKDVKKILLISGPPGVGKTTLASLILKKYNFKILEFNSSDIRSQKKIKEILGKTLEYRNIIEMINNESPKLGIIMDEIDTLTYGGDRGGITEFINLIKSNVEKNTLYNPIICTFNDFTDKKLTELRKLSLSISLNKFNNIDLEKIINKICIGENLNIEDEVKFFIAKNSSGDVRRLINLLYDLYIHNKINNKESNDIGNTITLEDVTNQQKVFMTKDTETNTVNFIKKILNTNISITESIDFFENNNYLISNVLYENYINTIDAAKNDKSYKIDMAYDIIKNIADGDIIYNNIFINHDWSTCYLSGLLTISYPNFIINKRTKNINEFIKIEYGPMFNKISNRSSNIKNLVIFNEMLNTSFNYNYSNILNFIIKINYYLFENENIKKIVSLLKENKLTIDSIEHILKLIKLNFYSDKPVIKKISAKFKKSLIAEFKNN